MTQWTDKHYDLQYKLTPEDIQKGSLRVDAYFVAKQWKTGSKDDSGALFHLLKTIARFGDKNTVEREIKALHAQVLGVARSFGVTLEEEQKATIQPETSKTPEPALWYPDDSGEWIEIDRSWDFRIHKGSILLETLSDNERENKRYVRMTGKADWWFDKGWGNKVAYKVVEE